MSRFRTTRWSLLAAAHAPPERARPAIEQLCRTYRPPVLAYIRRSGFHAEDAEDLAQAFFLHFLEQEGYARADRSRGRFRSLLLAALRHFLDDQQARTRALKRGGGARASDDGLDALESPGETPEQAFMRAWLGTVVGRALKRLRGEWERSGRLDRFERLAPLLVEAAEPSELRDAAAALGVRANTLAVQLHRMRQRLQQLVRLELSGTVDDRHALELELAEMRKVADGAE